MEDTHQLQSVGVIGAGVIGVGVSLCLAQSGYRVIVLDISNDRLRYAEQEVRKSMRLQYFLQRKVLKEQEKDVLSRITYSCNFEFLRDVSFVIENVTEKWQTKKQVYEQLDQICSSSCIFAANTSAIPITRIASVTSRPSSVIGMHFMNPVPLKSTVEVILGYHTSQTTLEAAKNLVKTMNKECVVVNDSPGFVSNRVLMLTINEAIFILQEGIASAEDIDKIFRSCFEHKMGPLETADLIGLDTVLFSIEVLYESFNDSKYRPAPLLKKMTDAGLYGKKSGQGFYSYQKH